MKSAPHEPPSEAFEQANALWFWDGRSHAAAALYEAAARQAPNDAACQYQWRQVQWALGRGPAAAAAAEGVTLPLPAGLQPDDLDVERLSGLTLSAAQWNVVALAAAQRQIFGVALYAQDHAKGSHVDLDEEKASWALVKRAESELARLAAMRAKKA
jgi:hypothetical protein